MLEKKYSWASPPPYLLMVSSASSYQTILGQALDMNENRVLTSSAVISLYGHDLLAMSTRSSSGTDLSLRRSPIVL